MSGNQKLLVNCPFPGIWLHALGTVWHCYDECGKHLGPWQPMACQPHAHSSSSASLLRSSEDLPWAVQFLPQFTEMAIAAGSLIAPRGSGCGEGRGAEGGELNSCITWTSSRKFFWGQQKIKSHLPLEFLMLNFSRASGAALHHWKLLCHLVKSFGT